MLCMEELHLYPWSDGLAVRGIILAWMRLGLYQNYSQVLDMHKGSWHAGTSEYDGSSRRNQLLKAAESGA